LEIDIASTPTAAPRAAYGDSPTQSTASTSGEEGGGCATTATTTADALKKGSWREGSVCADEITNASEADIATITTVAGIAPDRNAAVPA
jgi:hypothetical protein